MAFGEMPEGSEPCFGSSPKEDKPVKAIKARSQGEMTAQDIGILVTSYPGHKPYLRKCFKWIAECPHPVVFGWEDVKEFNCEKTLGFKLPPSVWRTFRVCFKSDSHRGKKRLHHGEKMQLLEGTRIINEMGCPYLFLMHGDNTIDDPGKIRDGLALLEGYDIVFFLSAVAERKGKGHARLDLESLFAKTKTFLRLLELHRFPPRGKHLLEVGLYQAANTMKTPFKGERVFWEELGFRHYHERRGPRRDAGTI